MSKSLMINLGSQLVILRVFVAIFLPLCLTINCSLFGGSTESSSTTTTQDQEIQLSYMAAKSFQSLQVQSTEFIPVKLINPSDLKRGDWAVIIGDEKISVKDFEEQYNLMKTQSKQDITIAQFFESFIASKLIEKEALKVDLSEYKDADHTLNLASKQLKIQYYLQHFTSEEETDTEENLKLFKAYLSSDPSFKSLQIDPRDEKEVKKAFDKYFPLILQSKISSKLKRRNLVLYNDAENGTGIYDLYIDGKLDLLKVQLLKDKSEEKPWIIKINQTYYMADEVNDKFNEFITQSRSVGGVNSTVKDLFSTMSAGETKAMFIDQFVQQELIFIDGEKKGLFNSKDYKEQSEMALKNMKINLYTSEVLFPNMDQEEMKKALALYTREKLMETSIIKNPSYFDR